MKRIGDTNDEATRRAVGALLDLYARFPDLVSKTAIGGGIAVAHWIGPQPDLGALNTADVDLVVDVVVGEIYRDLRGTLLGSGLYVQKNPKKPFAYWRKARTPAEEVEIDFQVSPVGGATHPQSKDIYKDVGDLKARVLIGGELALKHAATVAVVGMGPEGKEIRGEVRIVDPFILVPMKAIAFASRGLPTVPPQHRNIKDATDLFALLRALGPESLGKSALPYRHRILVEEAIMAMRAYFANHSGRGGEGPDAVVDYVQGRLPVEALRGQVVDLVSRYLGAVGG